MIGLAPLATEDWLIKKESSDQSGRESAAIGVEERRKIETG
jgi:hypothetical protein